MPQVKSNVESAWYVNRAEDVEGEPRSLTLGTITFAPGQKRFIEARVLLESRHTHERFCTALDNGNLAFGRVEETKPVVDEPVTETVVDEPVTETVVEETKPVVDEPVTETVVEETKPGVKEPVIKEPVVNESAAKRAVKRRGGKK